MGLPELWFVIIAILWVGFFVLEGFDFGVGMLHGVLGRTGQERRVAINTIGPFWDGNEVWLIVAGAGTFAAFPDWYASWFSASYLAVFLLLVALIIRGVSFEYRGKVDRPGWGRLWSGTVLTRPPRAPLVLGIARGALVAGLPIDADGEFTGSFWDLFTPFGLWSGVTLVVLCLVNGATCLGIRTTGELTERAHRAARVLGGVSCVVVAVYAVWLLAITDHSWGPTLPTAGARSCRWPSPPSRSPSPSWPCTRRATVGRSSCRRHPSGVRWRACSRPSIRRFSSPVRIPRTVSP